MTGPATGSPPRLHPFDYPWRPVSEPLMVSAHGVRTLDGLPPADQASRAGRRLLVAVGSNRAAEVLAAKLAGVPGSVLMAPARMDGLGIGHSAHVSRRGYLAAAPYDDPDGSAEVTLLWTGEQQVAALDATEPNYDRVVLDPDRYLLHPDVSEPVEIYATRHRLIAPDGVVQTLTSQLDLQLLLLAQRPIRDLLPDAEPGPEFCERLARDDVRSAVTALLPGLIGARAAGLVTGRHHPNHVIGSIS